MFARNWHTGHVNCSCGLCWMDRLAEEERREEEQKRQLRATRANKVLQRTASRLRLVGK